MIWRQMINTTNERLRYLQNTQRQQDKKQRRNQVVLFKLGTELKETLI